jgi:phytoene synthase
MSVYLYSWEKSLVEHALTHPLPEAGDLSAVDALPPALAADYAVTEKITRDNSRSFWLASRFLPAEKRRAVRALYAFCRITDDIVDLQESNQAERLSEWRRRVGATTFTRGRPVANAWLDTRIRYHIPGGYIEHFLDGVGMDLHKKHYSDFEELAHYCYGVASTVGLMSMSIVGFSGEEAVPYAVRLGVALQLTNILRDIGEDFERGRIYLPLDELADFGISVADLRQMVATGRYGNTWRELMRFQIQRTRELYAEAWPGIGRLHPEGRLAIAAAADLYAGILDDIEAHDYDVFSRRAHMPDWKKLAAVPGILMRVRQLPPFERQQAN